MRGLIPPPNSPNSSEPPPPSLPLTMYCLTALSWTPFTVPRHRLYVSSPYAWPHFCYFFIRLTKMGQEAGSQLLFGKLKEDVTCSSVHRQSVYCCRYWTICSADTFYTPGFSRRASVPAAKDFFLPEIIFFN